MAVDGHLNFDTKLNTEGFDKGAEKVEDKAEKTVSEVEKAAEKLKETVSESVQPDIDVSETERKIDSLENKIAALKKAEEMLSTPDQSLFGADGEYIDANAAMKDFRRLEKLEAVKAKLDELEVKKRELEQSVVFSVDADTAQAQDALDDIEPDIKEIGDVSEETGHDISSSFRKAGTDMESSIDSSAAHIMQSLESVKTGFKKVMAAAGIAFSFGAVVEFGKKSLESAAEVNAAGSQMSQTFRSLQGNAEAAMKRVADSSGIVQTRLQGVGTSIYAFARTSGMETSQALGMMEEALQVAADSAAYYDSSLEDTSDTLMSFLKGNYANDAALGLSATETTRNAAANKLYGKSFQELSEAQKQLTLLQMVKDANALSGAEGQAAREAEGWENVLGNLKESWRQLMAVLGQPVLQAVTAAVQHLTEALAFLTEKARAAMNTLSELTGFEFGSSSSSETIKENVAQTVEYQNDLTDAVEETAKAQEKSMAGFDKMNTISTDSSGSSSAAQSAGVPAVQSVPMTVTADTGGASIAVLDFAAKAKSVLERVSGYLDENFGDIFGDIWSGFVTETEELYGTVSRIFDDIKSLGPPLADYFQGDFTVLLQTAFATVGEILLGLFDTFNMVFADIWDLAVFPCLSAFINDGLPMLTQFCNESLLTFGTWFAEVKNIFDMLWKDAARPVLQFIAKLWSDLMSSLKKFWDKWGHPIFQKFRTAIETTGDLFRHTWQNYLKPVFDVLMETVNMLWDDHLKPLLDNFLDLVGTVIDAGLDIYNSFVAPLVSAFVDFMGPKIKAALTFLVKFIGDSIAGTIDVINAFIDILKGVVNFIAGVFTGDWRRAWDGIKSIFAGVWNALYAIVRRPINLIIDLVNGMTGAIERAVNSIIDCLNTLSWDVPDWVPVIGGETFGFDVDYIDIPEIPHLAKGTVVPANFGDYLAVLGDNKREPEVVSPLSTIKQAVKEALGENGGSAPQEITVYTYLYPNSAAFHREVVKIMADDRIRKGK